MRTRPSGAALCAVLAVSAALPGAAEDLPAPPPEARIVWLGELHDNPAHHRVQAGIVARLAPTALVFEMLEPRHAEAPADRADAGALAAAWEWADRGWPDFAMYHPIVAAAPEAAIRGAARPPGAVRRAVGEGALMVFGADGARFGLDVPLAPEEQAAREALQDAAHCGALPEGLLPGMVEAQRLRDADLAAAALAALNETGGPVAVIAGTGHVRADWGAPAMVARAAPDVAQWTLAQTVGAAEVPADLVLTAEPAPDAGDPCAGFR